MDIKQIITDIIKVKKYRCKNWANESELKTALVKLVSGFKWSSTNQLFQVVSMTVSMVNKLLIYTNTPVHKSVWLPMIEDAYNKILNDSKLFEKASDPEAILITEPIYEYLTISTQVSHLAFYYMNCKFNALTVNLDQVLSDIYYYCRLIHHFDVIKLVKQDTYNNKGKLLQYLNQEYVDCQLDYFYILTDQNSTPSARMVSYCKDIQKVNIEEPIKENFNIEDFIKKLTQVMENMHIAKQDKNTSIYDNCKNLIENMIIEFNVQKSKFEKSNPNNATLLKLYRDSEKLISEVQKNIEDL